MDPSRRTHLVISYLSMCSYQEARKLRFVSFLEKKTYVVSRYSFKKKSEKKNMIVTDQSKRNSSGCYVFTIGLTLVV